MNVSIRNMLSAALIMLGLSTPAQASPAVGQAAPDFRLQDQNGKWHTLGDFRGTWVALYFYPKDDTPGCTKEGCAFGDIIFAFEKIGATFLGVSLDDVASHEAFAEKYSLPFTLLADTDGKTAEEYGVLNSMAGMKFAKRQSFIIDPDGRVAKHYEKVNAEKHSEEELSDLQQLMPQD